MSDIIQSVDRALEVMIYLYHEGKETSITKIAADLGVYKSTVYRTLVTLENRGFVRKNPETERYWLGNRLFVLGKGVENRMGLPEIVRPYAKKLYDAASATVLRWANACWHTATTLTLVSMRPTRCVLTPIIPSPQWRHCGRS